MAHRGARNPGPRADKYATNKAKTLTTASREPMMATLIKWALGLKNECGVRADHEFTTKQNLNSRQHPVTLAGLESISLASGLTRSYIGRLT